MKLPLESLKKAEDEILRLSDAARDEFSKKYKTRSPEGWVYGETFEGGYKAGRKDAEVEFASFLETKRRKLGLLNAEVMLDVGYLIGFVEALRIGESVTEAKLAMAKKVLMQISEALKDSPNAVFGEEERK